MWAQYLKKTGHREPMHVTCWREWPDGSFVAWYAEGEAILISAVWGLGTPIIEYLRNIARRKGLAYILGYTKRWRSVERRWGFHSLGPLHKGDTAHVIKLEAS